MNTETIRGGLLPTPNTPLTSVLAQLTETLQDCHTPHRGGAGTNCLDLTTYMTARTGLTRLTSDLDADRERLDRIAAWIKPCSPYLYDGFLSCIDGAWPCAKTHAAWLARRLDPDQQAEKVVSELRSRYAAALLTEYSA